MLRKAIFLTACILLSAQIAYAGFRRGSGFSEGDLEMEKYAVEFHEKTEDPSVPVTDKIQIYAKDNSGTTDLYTQDSAGNVYRLVNSSTGGAPSDAQYLVSASNGTLSAEDVVTEGLAIDYTNGVGTGTFAFDPTEITGGTTWDDGGEASVAWTFNLSGTDPTITFSSATVTVGGTFDATTVTGANVTSGANPGHTHTSTSISGIDISADTNLTAGDNLTLTDDDLDLDAAVSIGTSITSPIFISNNSDTADAGIVRLGNTEGISWEAAPAGVDVTMTLDSSEIIQIANGTLDGGDLSSGTVTATQLGTDSVSDDELNATGVESELESALDIGGEVTSTGMASTVIADSVTVTGWVLGTSSATTLTSGTVNIDLLDGVGAVDMDYGSADITDHTFTTDSTGTAEIVLPAGSIDATEVLDATLTTSDLSGTAGITAAQTALTAGRSLTLSTNDILADAELYTHTGCYRLVNPVAGNDDKSIWINDTANGFTVTKLWCESDQTATLMLQVDDGTAADMDTVDLVCISTPDTDTSLDGDATIAAGDRVDLDVASVASTPTWVTVCWTGTFDD